VNGWWWLMKKNRLYYCVTPPTSSGNNYCGMESGARLYIGQIIGHDDDISWSRLLRDPWSASTRDENGTEIFQIDRFRFLYYEPFFNMKNYQF
jgi:hypothetical protein